MRITVQALLIFTACVSVTLGQARLPVFVGIVCLMIEIIILTFLLPSRLSHWRSTGFIVGILLGCVVFVATLKWTDINSLSSPNLLELQASQTAWIARVGRLLPYCIQVGALVGYTVGLILGEVRWQCKQRTSAARS